MLSLNEFISFLPGVMPKKTRSLIFEGDILSKEDMADIFYRDAYRFDTVQLIGPDAATAVLAAYEAGKLPMIKGRVIETAPAAAEYANDSVLRERVSERRRKDACVKDISLVKESDFSDSRLLDRIFWEHLGKGEGTLTLAGIAVFKSLSGFRTNSGKNTDYEVTFSWSGSDGEARTSGTGKPPAAFNRRNDEDRDWGLPD